MNVLGSIHEFMSLVALCKEQIKVRIQVQNMWLLNSSSGSSALGLSTFV